MVVFVCFVDFRKASDTVNYWKLFQKLSDEDLNGKITKLLAFWYSNQECFVRWRNVQSAGFYLNKNLCGRDGRTICGPQRVPKSTCVSL